MKFFSNLRKREREREEDSIQWKEYFWSPRFNPMLKDNHCWSIMFELEMKSSGDTFPLRIDQMTRRVRVGTHSIVDWRWWSRKVDLIKLLDAIGCPRTRDPEDLSLSVDIIQWQRFHSTKCVTESSSDKQNPMSNNHSIHLFWMKESRMIDDGIRLFRKNIRFIRYSSPLLHHEFQSIIFVIRSWASKIVLNDHSNRRRPNGVTMKRVDDRRRIFLQWLEDQMQKKRILRSTRSLRLKHGRHRNVSPCPSLRSTRWKRRKTDGSSRTSDEQFNWERREISSETERFLSKISCERRRDNVHQRKKKSSSFRICSADRSIIDIVFALILASGSTWSKWQRRRKVSWSARDYFDRNGSSVVLHVWCISSTTSCQFCLPMFSRGWIRTVGDDQHVEFHHEIH